MEEGRSSIGEATTSIGAAVERGLGTGRRGRSEEEEESRGGGGGGGGDESPKRGGKLLFGVANVGGSLTVLLQIALVAWGVRQLRSLLDHRRQRLEKERAEAAARRDAQEVAMQSLSTSSSLSSSSSPSPSRPVDQVPFALLSPVAVRRLVELDPVRYVFVDVRFPAAVNDSPAPFHAVLNIPESELSASLKLSEAEWEGRYPSVRKIGLNDLIVFLSTKGHRAQRAANVAAGLGYSGCCVLSGGIEAYSSSKVTYVDVPLKFLSRSQVPGIHNLTVGVHQSFQCCNEIVKEPVIKDDYVGPVHFQMQGEGICLGDCTHSFFTVTPTKALNPGSNGRLRLTISVYTLTLFMELFKFPTQELSTNTWQQAPAVQRWSIRERNNPYRYLKAPSLEPGTSNMMIIASCASADDGVPCHRASLFGEICVRTYPGLFNACCHAWDAVATILEKHQKGEEIAESGSSSIYLLDVRRYDELTNFGHIKGSQNIPVTEFTKALTLDEDAWEKSYHFPKIAEADTVIFQCRANGRASWAAQLAQDAGFERCFVYKDGILGWRLDPTVQPYHPYKVGDTPPDPIKFEVETVDHEVAKEELQKVGLG